MEIKRLIGKGLIAFCEFAPSCRPHLRHIGVRTKMEWFGDKIVRVPLPNGRTLRLASVASNFLSFELFWRGVSYYEPYTAALLHELTSENGTFLDIGANIGFYSLLLSSAYPNCKIVAFEPNPEIYNLLKANVTANKLSCVRCEQIALSNACGAAQLFLSGSHMSASLEKGFSHLEVPPVEVQTDTLDNYLNTLNITGSLVIKMDVEGHEESAMGGAQETIYTLRPDIIVEVASPHETEPFSFLKDLGYSYYTITDKGLLRTPVLAPNIRKHYWFPNYLLSVRPEAEIKSLSDAVEEQCQGTDIDTTCLVVDDEKIKRLMRM